RSAGDSFQPPRLQLLLPPPRIQCFERSGGFRLFFTSAAALAKNNSLPNDLRDKRLLMLRPPLRNYFVNWGGRRDVLQELLKISLRINVHRLFCQFLEIATSLRQNEAFGHLETAIEVKRADERFECICQGGRTLSTTTRFFAAAHQNIST